MFLMEYAAAAKELKELEEKNIIAQNQLKDTQSSYDRTKVEYERLEQELEDLNSKMDARRIDPDITHDQNLFQLFIKIFINTGKTTENTVKSGYDVVSGLCQSTD